MRNLSEGLGADRGLTEVTGADFERAAKGGDSLEAGETPAGCATGRTSRVTQLLTAKGLSGEDRIRTPQENTGKTGVSIQSGAKSGALGAREALPAPDLAGLMEGCDGELVTVTSWSFPAPDLAALMEGWADLPEADRERILELARNLRGDHADNKRT